MTIVAVTSCIHSGSTLGLCPDEVELDDGGIYKSSPAQKWLWENVWVPFWTKVRELSVLDELIYVNLGEAIEGTHHGTTQLISSNYSDQMRCAEKVFDIMPSPDETIWFRGTHAHVGASGQWDEMIGKKFNGIKNGKLSSWYWGQFQVEDVLFDFAHHGKAGNFHTKGNSVNALAYHYEYHWLKMHQKYGMRVPDVVCRGHVHKHYDTGNNFGIRWIQVPSFQLQTEFGHKLSPGMSLPVGGVIFKVDGSNVEVHNVLVQPKPNDPVKL